MKPKEQAKEVVDVVSEFPSQSQSLQNAPPLEEASSSFIDIQNSQDQNHKQDYIGNDIDLYWILDGLEDRTTVMIRNIPNKFKQRTLLDIINECHIG